MLKASLILKMLCALVVTIAFGAGDTASADPILPGFDLFATAGGTTVTIPDVGVVAMTGRPIDPGRLGDTDTIVQRLGMLPDLPIGGQGTIPIQLLQVSLTSVAPVFIGAGTYILNVDEFLPQPGGSSMTITRTEVDGGTFIATLNVRSLVTFTPITGPPIAPVEFSHELTTGAPWSFTRPLGYPVDPMFPDGNFFAGVLPGTGGMRGLIIEQGPVEVHIVTPATIPEPATLLLLGTGLAGVAGFAKKRLFKRE